MQIEDEKENVTACDSTVEYKIKCVTCKIPDERASWSALPCPASLIGGLITYLETPYEIK
jgi:hypothetical protein